jgi:hypothetical protein
VQWHPAQGLPESAAWWEHSSVAMLGPKVQHYVGVQDVSVACLWVSVAWRMQGQWLKTLTLVGCVVGATVGGLVGACGQYSRA